MGWSVATAVVGVNCIAEVVVWWSPGLAAKLIQEQLLTGE
jgi:hypothetical protein